MTRGVTIAYDCLFPLSLGGGERQYDAFARALAARGETVTYLTSRQWEGEPPVAAYRVETVTGRLRLYDARGVRRSGAALRFAAGLFRRLLRARRTERAVIVSGVPVLNVFAARLALLGSRTTVVVDYLEVWRRDQWIDYAGRAVGTVAWMLQRAAIALTPTATCHSRLSADRLLGEGFRGRLLLSPGLVDNIAETAAPTAAARPPFVVYAGRHIPDKRVQSLPAAVANARSTYPDLELVILGEGATTAEVEREIEAVGGAAWTRLPGFVSQRELDSLMSRAVCLANPSRREGYGLVVVESASHGTPVVLAADEGNAATELVRSGVNGYVAPSTEPADLAAAIVACVRGGDVLRRSTHEWYLEIRKTGTVALTIDAIVAEIDARTKPETAGT